MLEIKKPTDIARKSLLFEAMANTESGVMGDPSAGAILYEPNSCRQPFGALSSFRTTATDKPEDPHFSSKVLTYLSVFPEMRTPKMRRTVEMPQSVELGWRLMEK